ncbi:MAG: DNA circularization N-terminal domain-containing protein, partial [Terriglobales bacterium]
MSWRERRQPGSFRGVRFEFLDVEGTHGRRTAVYEYPLRDKPDTEDMGRKARQFTIQAFVIGADYDGAREALVNALDEKGPGIFVHPTRGELLVAVIDARLSESTSEGGLAKFTITFVESSGGIRQPISQRQSSEALLKASDAAADELSASFLQTFKSAGVPEFLRVAAAEIVSDAVTALKLELPDTAEELVAVPVSLAGAIFTRGETAEALTLPELE